MNPQNTSLEMCALWLPYWGSWAVVGSATVTVIHSRIHQGPNCFLLHTSLQLALSLIQTCNSRKQTWSVCPCYLVRPVRPMLQACNELWHTFSVIPLEARSCVFCPFVKLMMSILSNHAKKINFHSLQRRIEFRWYLILVLRRWSLVSLKCKFYEMHPEFGTGREIGKVHVAL